jgi:ribonuclease R
VFVKLEGTGADGLIPMRALGGEFFHYERDSQSLIGADSRRVIGLGARVTVKLAEAVPVTGGLLLELLTLDGEDAPRGTPRRSGKPMKRRLGAAKAGDKGRTKRGAHKVSRNH